MKTEAQTKELNLNSLSSKTINLLVATGLLIGTATTHASDHELWRDQVATNFKTSEVTVSLEKGGNSFLDAVRENHLPNTQNSSLDNDAQRQLLSDTETIGGNWFFNAISPNTYYGS